MPIFGKNCLKSAKSSHAVPTEHTITGLPAISEYEPLFLKSIRWVQDDILGFVPSSCRFLKELYFKFRKIEQKNPKKLFVHEKLCHLFLCRRKFKAKSSQKNFFGTCHAMVNFLQTIKQFKVFLF